MEPNKEVDGSQLVDTLLDLCTAALEAGPTIYITDPATFIMATSWGWVLRHQKVPLILRA